MNEERRVPAETNQLIETIGYAVDLPGMGVFDWNLLTDDLAFNGDLGTTLKLPERSKRRLIEGFLPEVLDSEANWLVLIIARVPSFNGLAFFDRCVKCQLPDGRHVWLRVRGNIAFNDDSVRRRPIRIRGIVDDVTGLYGKIDHYNAIFESIGEGVVSFDSDWKYVYVNKNAEKLLGRSADQLVGEVFWDAFPEVLHSPLERVFRDAMAGQNTYYEHFYEPWNRWFGNYCSKSSSGGVTVVFQDVTDKKLSEHARQTAEHKALIEKTTIAAQTVAAVAHELNQPLMVLEANSSSLKHLLKNAKLSQDVQSIVLENEKQTKRAGNIFRELIIKISGWRQNQKVSSRYNLHALIEACVRQTMARFPELQINLMLGANQHHTFGDEAKIEKALLNVLANAAESNTVSQTNALEFAIQTSNVNNCLLICISDSGTGISDEIQSSLFTGFASTKEKGLGLGLSITKSLLEDQGGKIWFHGNLNPGAEFRMEIPLTHEAQNDLPD